MTMKNRNFVWMRSSNCEDKSQEKFCAVSRFIEFHTLFYQISNLEKFAIKRRLNYLVQIPPSREYIFQRHFPGNGQELLIQVKLAVGIWRHFLRTLPFWTRRFPDRLGGINLMVLFDYLRLSNILKHTRLILWFTLLIYHDYDTYPCTYPIFNHVTRRLLSVYVLSR